MAKGSVGCTTTHRHVFCNTKKHVCCTAVLVKVSDTRWATPVPHRSVVISLCYVTNLFIGANQKLYEHAKFQNKIKIRSKEKTKFRILEQNWLKKWLKNNQLIQNNLRIEDLGRKLNFFFTYITIKWRENVLKFHFIVNLILNECYVFFFLSKKGTVLKSMNQSGLNISVEVPNQLDEINESNRNKSTELSDPLDVIPSVTCKILLNSAQTCCDVKLHINCNDPLVAEPNSVSYSSIGM